MAIELRRDYLVSEMVALQNRAFAEGQAFIYAEIRKLPSPWGYECIASDGSGELGEWFFRCSWCKVTQVHHLPINANAADQIQHPDNSCLWFKAHAERC